MDSLDAISRDFLRGQELMLNAFNRLLAWRQPVVPVALDVRAEVMAPQPKGAEPTSEGGT